VEEEFNKGECGIDGSMCPSVVDLRVAAGAIRAMALKPAFETPSGALGGLIKAR
jgi:hypothetical protein